MLVFHRSFLRAAVSSIVSAAAFSLCAGLVAPSAWAATPSIVSAPVAGRYLVVYRDGQVPADAASRVGRAGARLVSRHERFGMVAVAADAASRRQLLQDSSVEYVIQDRVVTGTTVLRSAVEQDTDGSSGGRLRSQLKIARAPIANPVQASPTVVQPPATPPAGTTPSTPVSTSPGTGTGSGSGTGTGSGTGSGGGSGAGSGGGSGAGSGGGSGTGTGGGTGTGSPPVSTPATNADTFYSGTPQGWAVKAAGGFGYGVAGGTSHGAWDHTFGQGIRIAVLDSGVDATHPDIAPNLAFNLSEVDKTALPSACDDGTPQDQAGHGTWVASLAAGALGSSTGRVVGMAPSAAILNIKVLERVAGTGTTALAQCTTGEASGLVSWLLKGIDDAVAQHADVIVMSLGSIVDLYSGDGAGLKVSFDRVTHAAAQAGVVLVAAAGNDGFDLSNTRYVSLPAQARDVLAVVASTNPACAENTTAGSVCTAGAVTRPYYSNFGAPLNAIAAPGGSLPLGAEEGVSGWVRGACSSGKPNTVDGLLTTGGSLGCFNLGHQAYVQGMGTSAAAPLVAGAAALVRAAHPAWDPATVINALRSSAKQVPTMAAGLVDAGAAIDYLP